MAVNAILSKGVELGFKTSSETNYTEVEGITSVPALGGTIEKVDVTTLKNNAYVYIPGLQTYDDLEFGMIYDKAIYKTVDTAIRTVDPTTHVSTYHELDWKVSFPDGVYFTFKGTGNLRVEGAEVNGALTATLTITPKTEIIPTFPQ